jgi:hypothetical protein
LTTKAGGGAAGVTIRSGARAALTTAGDGATGAGAATGSTAGAGATGGAGVSGAGVRELLFALLGEIRGEAAPEIAAVEEQEWTP